MDILDRAAELSRIGRTTDAVMLIRQAAKAGNGEALVALANWAVYGINGPRDPRAAHPLLQRAAMIGHAPAITLRATLLANGTGVAADWKGALNLLRAAARRDPDAQRQIELLDAMHLDADGATATLPAAEVLSDDPYIAMIRGLLTPAECDYLVATATPQLRVSTIIDPNSGRSVPHPIRTSYSMNYHQTLETPVIRALNRRFAAATASEVGHGEPLAVLRYEPGQEYRAHLDAITGATNQRITTLLVYLNDDYAGGETRFAEIDLVTKGRAGDALLFRNVGSDGRPDARTRHAGLPVTSGVKWLCSRWIRARDFDPVTDR